MSLIAKLDGIVKKGRDIWENTRVPEGFSVDLYQSYQDIKKQPDITDETQINKLIQGDNIAICKYLSKTGYAGKLKLIYVDPPFFSKTDYKSEIKLTLKDKKTIPVIRQKAYKDSWEHGMEEYLTMLAARLYGFRELLSDEGSIWVHLDWHAVHYTKVIMDEIFGEQNFINEVVWNYKSGGATKRRYSRKHDTLLFYSKTSSYYFKPQQEKSYNRGFKPYRFKGVKEYKDEKGWYTLVNMKDVWQMDMVGRTSAERTGYATQKPETLISRILESCTEKGDICADFFGGSGTMAAAADKMERRWISCDIGNLSSINTLKRMVKNGSSFIFITAQSEAVKSYDAASLDSSSVYDAGGIDVDVLLKKVPSSSSEHITVKLTGYTFDKDFQIPVDEKDMSYINDILANDWLQLIDYFAVDFDYDGKVFKPSVYAAKEGECIAGQVEVLCYAGGTIAVKAVDIFGNVSMKVL